MNTPLPGDVAKRHSVWIALAELYLDTELGEDQLQRIARVFTASAYTWAEIRQINYDDVAPALWFNVQDIAGEWAGWDEEWLLKRITAHYSGKPHKTLGFTSIWQKRVDFYTAQYLAKIALYMI